jgi:hypothetical protein
MKKIKQAIYLSIASFFVFSQTISVLPQTQNSERKLLPTEALHTIFQELQKTLDKQREVTKGILPRVQAENISSDERFALGEAYLVSLMPKESTVTFEKFRSGKDLRARFAWQRVLLITNEN